MRDEEGRERRTEKSSEIPFVETLGLEQAEEVCGRSVHIWEQSVGCGSRGVFASDVRLDPWAPGTCHDGVVACENWMFVRLVHSLSGDMDDIPIMSATPTLYCPARS
jgi:hypothetical protein